MYPPRLTLGNFRAVSVVGEPDRTMLRGVIKRSYRTEDADESIRHRLIPDDAVKSMHKRLEEVKEDVSEVLKGEMIKKEVRREFPSHQVTMPYGQIRKGEMKIKKGQNMIEHKEIFLRPKKIWFTSEKAK